MPQVRRMIHAAREQVWEVLADPATYPTWLVGAQVIRGVDDEFPAEGTDFQHRVGPAKEASLADRTTSLAADAPSLLKLKVRARPLFVGEVTFRLVPTKAGTELVLEEEPVGPLRFLRPLLSPVTVARNKRSLEKLARLVEDGAGSGHRRPAASG